LAAAVNCVGKSNLALSLVIILGCSMACVYCGPIAELKSFSDADLTPPVLVKVCSLSPTEIELTFDEQCTAMVEGLKIQPELEISGVTTREQTIILTVSLQTPGSEYTLEAVVEDAGGNSLSFISRIYGYNPSIPELLINEFITRGTGNHPDVVELRILSPGNMGGVTLYQGTPDNWRDRLIFPPFAVAEDNFIIIHFRPEGLPEEINETEAMDLSGGLDASDDAFDFWIAAGSGISGNNGVISLYEQPGGRIIDGVLYSDRTSESDTAYRGFGTLDALERADELAADHGWIISFDLARPEDAVSPEGSTGTRSICRSSLSTDTDTLADWHIVPTRGATFGYPNSDEIYTP